MIGATVQRRRLPLLSPESEFSADGHMIPERSERFTDPLLAGIKAIHFGRIAKGHSLIIRSSDQGDHIPFFELTAVVANHRKTPQANS